MANTKRNPIFESGYNHGYDWIKHGGNLQYLTTELKARGQSLRTPWGYAFSVGAKDAANNKDRNKFDKTKNMSRTKLMQRIFSAQSNGEVELLKQFSNDIEIAKEDGLLTTEEYSIVADEEGIDIHDHANNEITHIDETDEKYEMSPKELTKDEPKKVEFTEKGRTKSWSEIRESRYSDELEEYWVQGIRHNQHSGEVKIVEGTVKATGKNEAKDKFRDSLRLRTPQEILVSLKAFIPGPEGVGDSRIHKEELKKKLRELEESVTRVDIHKIEYKDGRFDFKSYYSGKGGYSNNDVILERNIPISEARKIILDLQKKSVNDPMYGGRRDFSTTQTKSWSEIRSQR